MLSYNKTEMMKFFRLTSHEKWGVESKINAVVEEWNLLFMLCRNCFGFLLHSTCDLSNLRKLNVEIILYSYLVRIIPMCINGLYFV